MAAPRPYVKDPLPGVANGEKPSTDLAMDGSEDRAASERLAANRKRNEALAADPEFGAVPPKKSPLERAADIVKSRKPAVYKATE